MSLCHIISFHISYVGLQMYKFFHYALLLRIYLSLMLTNMLVVSPSRIFKKSKKSLMDICSTLNGLLMFIIISALCNLGLQGVYCIFYKIWVFTPPMIVLPQITHKHLQFYSSQKYSTQSYDMKYNDLLNNLGCFYSFSWKTHFF